MYKIIWTHFSKNQVIFWGKTSSETLLTAREHGWYPPRIWEFWRLGDSKYPTEG